MMDIRFPVGEAAPSPVVADHVRRSLHSRLINGGERIQSVEVRLGNTGISRLRQDMYCLMQVQLIGLPATSIVDIGPDVYATIDRAADRVGRLAEAQLQAAKAPRADSSDNGGAISRKPSATGQAFRGLGS